MCRIVVKLEEKLAEYDSKGDILGDAYEILIAKFAAESVKKAGEFYTPQPVSTITIAYCDAGLPRPSDWLQKRDEERARLRLRFRLTVAASSRLFWRLFSLSVGD